MDLRQLAGFGRAASAEKPSEPTFDRCLTLMVEGAALNMLEIDAESYKTFRSKVNEMAMQVPDRLPIAEKLAQIQIVLREFESYRHGAEGALRERLNGWRSLASTLFREHLASLGIDAASSEAAALAKRIAGLTTAAQIQSCRDQLAEFLHPNREDKSASRMSPLKAADRSTANDNAAGLRGGGSAVEHVRRIMESGESGYAVLFRLGCLEMINQRFGQEAVQDCLMAVSAFLAASLGGEDVIYHWSDSLLLGVVSGQHSEDFLKAELRRISAQNREISIKIGARNVMVRVPLDFDITPINRLRAAEDLNKLSIQSVGMW